MECDIGLFLCFSGLWINLNLYFQHFIGNGVSRIDGRLIKAEFANCILFVQIWGGVSSVNHLFGLRPV